jgi:signal transduction histidine kinase
MMFHSLRSRLLLSYILVTGLVLTLVALSLVIFLFSSPVVDRLVLQRLETIAALTAGRPIRNLESVAPERFESALERFGIENGRVLILDSSGEILRDSEPALRQPPPLELRGVASATRTVSGSFRGALNRRWLYVASPVEGGGAVMLAVPRPVGLLGLGDELLTPILRAGGVGLIVSLLSAFFIARWIASPLQKTAQAAQAVADGDYSQSLELVGPDEAKNVAAAFNEMVSKVRASQVSTRDFVANVSHELKTPLTSIQGFAQAILDGAAADVETQTAAAQVIYTEASRMQRLVDELLDLTRLDAGQVLLDREPVDLQLLLGAVMARLRMKASEKGIVFHAALDEMPPIMGDGDRLSQVFTNLLDNAIKHAPEGGRIEISGRKEAASVVLQILDNGPGIPASEHTRIFERFYRIDKARAGGDHAGAGLGLAITKELVELHGGRICVESELGQGSKFLVELPIIQPGDQTIERKR